jgi:hypothetical protein
MAADGELLEIVELDMNLSDVEKPPELPNGSYDAEVQDVQVSTSANSGNDYYGIKLRILPESIPADMTEFFEDGAQLSYNRILVPNGKDRRRLYNVKKLLIALGLPTNVTVLDPNEWMGRPVKVTVKQTKFDGEMRAGITGLLAPDGSVQVEEEEEAAPVAKAAPKTASRGRR